jgi:hypothetical protein
MLLPPATVSPGTSGCPLCRAAAAVVIAFGRSSLALLATKDYRGPEQTHHAYTAADNKCPLQ